MSREKNNINNEELRKLLDQASDQKNSDAGDFEKEALEGFAMLGSEEEALDLKQSLDDRIYAKVFTAEKKSSARTYWLAAAAGLVLIIGFSVYFINNNHNNITKNSDLAITDVKTPLKEETPPSTPLQDSVAGNETEISKPVLKKEDKKENEVKAKKAIERTKIKALETTVAVLEDQKESHKSLQEESAADIDASTNDGVAVVITKDQATSVITPGNNTIQNSTILNNATPNTNGYAAPPSNAPVSGIISPEIAASTKYKMQSIEKESIKKKSLESKKQSARPASAKSSSPSRNAEDITFLASAAYYTGGEEALKKDVSEKLKAKKLDQKFEAVLFINENKTVKKVKLTNAYALTQEQQKQVMEILKSLDKFNVLTKAKSLVEYKLAYTP